MGEIDIAPHFGAELKDGFKPVNTWVTSGISWLDDVQAFYRERGAIEKEYSVKLTALAKKYFEKKTKKTSSLSVGDTPTVTPGSLESASMTTWTVQLNTLESRAAEHDKFSTELISSLAEPVKHLSVRCEDLRKQHVEYAAKLERERDNSYTELKKTKGKYDSTCQEMENRRKKIDSAFDSSKQKAQSAYVQQQADMLNAKNSYLININVTNKQKEKYYHDYVPSLLDSLQDLSESRVARLNAIWLQAASVENQTLGRCAELVKHCASEIPRNNPVLDSMMFVRHNAGSWQEPADFVFEPSPVWLDDDGMSSSEQSKVYLRNILGKSKSQLSDLKFEIDNKRRELEGLQKKRQAIREGKDKSDEVEVARAIFAMQEEFHDVERRKINAEVEVATINVAVGDVSVGAQNHNFKTQTFKIPTNCDLCGERIWGLSAKGFDCRDCGFTCHSKCEMKVPADCPGEQDKDQRRRLKVERQDAAHNAPAIEEMVPEKQTSVPVLARRDTMASMNTLSSGYAASAHRSVSGVSQAPPPEEPAAAPTESPKAVSKPPTSISSRPRVLAPPPTAYVKDDGVSTNGHVASSRTEPRARMLYGYEKNGEGELTVDEGREVTVLEQDDGSGWMKVRSGALEGLVPASYAEVLPVSTSTSHSHSHSLSTNQTQTSDNERPGSTYSASSASLAGSIGGAMKKKGPAVAPKRGAKRLKYVEALYDYEARSEAEHSITEGDRLVLINRDAGDGWADVERGGRVGSVPANYIQDVP